MKILVDENIPSITVHELRNLGHHVLDVRGTPQQGMEDAELWPEDSSLQQISKEIAFLAGIRAAEEQANRGDLIDHERIREELQTSLG